MDIVIYSGYVMRNRPHIVVKVERNEGGHEELGM
jgi:hypothetical protein